MDGTSSNRKRQERTNNVLCVPHDQEGFAQELPTTRARKWPVLFWFILKVLCLFHHKTVVARRKCYLCNVDSRIARLKLLRMADPECRAINDDVSNDHLVLAYGWSSKDAAKEQAYSDVCATCSAQWWNTYGVPVPYTEEDIGVAPWNHRGSGLVSVVLLLAQISVLGYNGGVPIYEMWGRPDHIIHLIMRLMLTAWLSIYPILALFSVIMRLSSSGISTQFDWVTVLNVRYLIKQAQFLNLPTKGLPGKPFLILCGLTPLAVMGSRAFIFLFLGKCDDKSYVYRLSSSLLGLIFVEVWCSFMYILYFVRDSFQRRFNLHLTHIRENKSNPATCRGALFDTARDFSCFKQIVDLFTALMLPCAVFAIIANISWNYLLTSASCLWKNDDHSALYLQIYLAILYWTEIGVAILIAILAIGGFQVGNMWDNFRLNLLQYKVSDNRYEFWRELFHDMKQFDKGSKVLLASVVCSVMGVYAGLQYGDQSIVYLSAICGSKNATDYVCN